MTGSQSSACTNFLQSCDCDLKAWHLACTYSHLQNANNNMIVICKLFRRHLQKVNGETGREHCKLLLGYLTICAPPHTSSASCAPPCILTHLPNLHHASLAHLFQSLPHCASWHTLSEPWCSSLTLLWTLSNTHYAFPAPSCTPTNTSRALLCLSCISTHPLMPSPTLQSHLPACWPA